jgi:hypothetical protein
MNENEETDFKLLADLYPEAQSPAVALGMLYSDLLTKKEEYCVRKSA